MVDGKVAEASELQCGEKGSPYFDFLSTEWKKGELTVEMGGLVGNLPDLGKIMHLKGFSCGRKGVGVKDDKIKGWGTPQDVPNVEFFEPGLWTPRNTLLARQ